MADFGGGVCANRILLAYEQTFRPWTIDQPLLLPPSVQDFVGGDHLARFVLALVLEHLELGEIEAAYASERGQPPFDPAMMTALLRYADCDGVYSSRRFSSCAGRRGWRSSAMSRSTARRSRRTPPSTRR